MENKCVGCDTVIPYGATKCPMCGAPAPVQSVQVIPPQIIPPREEVHHHHHIPHPVKPVLIEQTGKKWKKMHLWSVVLFSLGVVSCVGGANDHNAAAMMASVFCWMAGAAVYVYARFGAWWHHG